MALFAATPFLGFVAEILGFGSAATPFLGFEAESILGFVSDRVLWFRTTDLSEELEFLLSEGGAAGVLSKGRAAGFSAAGRVLTSSCSESDKEGEGEGECWRTERFTFV